ncbi:MAG TPA: 5'-nucleotidase C-terminal domain-containing protein [Spirochaetia bacterium]|nr:5'-nucleotidase C-terminal domain-containing protein [Spirochaetia bacterium]
MRSIPRGAAAKAASLTLVCLFAAAQLWADPSGTVDLTILHVNDTHSMLEPSPVRLNVDLGAGLSPATVYVNLGGFPAVMTALARLRSETQGATLFLHAGDFFQGSLYFTEYHGAADVDFWNSMGLDAATLGNHEFDKGPGLIQTALLDKARFPLTSANVDVSREPSITTKDRLAPYVIREVGGQRIGIIGITTPATPYISSPGPNVVFRDPAQSVDAAVQALRAEGVTEIIALTHLGLDADRALASRIHHVALIVGGHSHTLLGSYPSVGLKGIDSYPVVAADADGQTVLIVQAWQWAYQIGRIRVSLDPDGRVVGFDAHPVFVANRGFARIYDLPNLASEKKRVQFTEHAGTLDIREFDGGRYSVPIVESPGDPGDLYHRYEASYRALEARLTSDPNVFWVDPDPAGQATLDGYAAGVAAFREKPAASVAEEMRRGENSGPGPIIADAMAWQTGAQVAIVNPGGVRTDLVPGELTVARVYELQPFGDTLVTVPVTGEELTRVLEDMADFTLGSYGTGRRIAHLYVSGLFLSLDASKPKGRRISNVRVREADGSYAALVSTRSYTLVVNSFMAAGGDRNTTLADLPGKYDTGYGDSEALLAYIDGKTLSNVPEERVRRIR